MAKKYSRRFFLKRIISSIVGAFLASALGYYYAKYIEPKMIHLTKHTIQHPLIPSSFNFKKIVQFSDTHVGPFFTIEQLEEVVEKINQTKPDIVLFTGDLLDEPNKYPFPETIPPILSKIQAPLGKYCIYGNHDHGGYGTEIYKEIMHQGGFTLLKNSSAIISQDGENIVIAGLDDAMLGRPDYTHTFASFSKESLFTILLVHEPDLAPQSAYHGAHIQLSGHSHGGQIQLPFLGPLVTPPLGSKYYEGTHTIENLTLFVNKGLGTTRLPFRFLAIPEISVYTLKSPHSKE
ncbi:metallophosphoesterase [Bacillus luteolus]|uniref:Metallophosphoesterase n=1 Tax=Litchfieldia luteola TaxID=682179 RepID=A0ABR9QKA4_9BACI|nr:metallophosphoesterase [Cytobacillus luteolus]MBE4908930.1 metallophosphoesterase [Cytobacillus luteolus]MBP1941789.1 putative MPP superfamily phosphohydrolase [Cytobacillus luteolus]